jgi:hypothetical protein
METLMSRGPGRVECAIEAILTAEADNAFTVEDLCKRIYPRVRRISKKHRVSVLRAAKRLAQRRDTLTTMGSDTRGGAVVYYTCDNVMSYAMARRKGDFLFNYGDTQMYSRQYSEDDLRKQLAEGGKDHRLVVEGGVWWVHTQEAIEELDAKRAGDDEHLKCVRERIHAERDRRLAEFTQGIVTRAAGSALKGNPAQS